MKNTRLTSLLNIKYPIIQGGMAWASNTGLASAVSACGGLGLLGSSTMSPIELSREIDMVREKTGNAFGVNIVLMEAGSEEKVAVSLAKKISVAVLSAGSPKKFTKTLKDAGIIVGHVVPSGALAKKAEDAGVDFVVAESIEAGGHDGIDEISNFTLIPLVKQSVSIPVVAAGGIVSGRQIAAAMILGADGVQMGTRFVATNECAVHQRFKGAIVSAGEDGTVFIAKKYRPQRVLKNPFAENIRDMESRGATAEEIRAAYGPSRGRKGCIEGDWEEGYFNCGQGAALIDKVLSVPVLFENLIKEYEEAISIIGREL